MFCRNFTSFICIFVAAVVATVHNDSPSITESNPEVKVYPLTTENPESSTREPDQQYMNLGAMLDAGDGAIVTLVTGETRLVAHKAVLATRSPVFAAILQHMALEASSGQVAVHNVEGPVLRHLVAYMYTLQAPQMPHIAPQLLVAADTYGLPALKAHCEQQVIAQLSMETAVTSALLAVRHSCNSLRQAAIAFIKANIFQVMATQGWADAMESQRDDLMQVVRLLPDAPARASVPANGGNEVTPTTQPHSDHSSHTGLTTFPSDDAVSCICAPATADSGAALTDSDSGATPSTPLHSDDSLTPATTAPSTPARQTPTPDYALVSALWSLSTEEKGRRLIEGAMDGAVEEVEALLAAGADVGARNERGGTALHYAAEKGHVEVARRLLAAGASVEARSRGQWTPLHVAAANGHAAVVQLLVEETTADLNARTMDGRTPLHWAAYNGYEDVAAVLLQAGADRTIRDHWEETPLDIAKKYNRQQLIDMLIWS